MAIYHLHVERISRGGGKSCVAAAAYRAAEELKDDLQNMTHDYTKKKGVESEIIAPEHAPDWVHDRQKLWNEVDRSEKRVDANTAREINIALPVELTKQQQKDLIRDFVKENFLPLGMVADVAFHFDNKDNPHCHIMLTTRAITSEGFNSKKISGLDDQRKTIDPWRASWANHANRALEKAGHSERIDHRTNKARGLDQLPTKNIGVHAWQMEQKGIKTELGDINRAIKKYNRKMSKYNRLIKLREEKLEREGKSVHEKYSLRKQHNSKHHRMYTSVDICLYLRLKAFYKVKSMKMARYIQTCIKGYQKASYEVKKLSYDLECMEGEKEKFAKQSLNHEKELESLILEKNTYEDAQRKLAEFEAEYRRTKIYHIFKRDELFGQIDVQRKKIKSMEILGMPFGRIPELIKKIKACNDTKYDIDKKISGLTFKKLALEKEQKQYLTTLRQYKKPQKLNRSQQSDTQKSVFVKLERQREENLSQTMVAQRYVKRMEQGFRDYGVPVEVETCKNGSSKFVFKNAFSEVVRWIWEDIKKEAESEATSDASDIKTLPQSIKKTEPSKESVTRKQHTDDWDMEH